MLQAEVGALVAIWSGARAVLLHLSVVAIDIRAASVRDVKTWAFKSLLACIKALNEAMK